MAECMPLADCLSDDAVYLFTAAEEKKYQRRLKILMSLRGAGNMGPSCAAGHPNRLAFFNRRSIRPDKVASLTQIHSRKVWTAEEALEQAAAGDGLITGSPEHVLAVTVADCLPVFLYHPSGTPFAAVHSGWKGTGIAAEAVRRMGELYGTAAGELRAVIGPGIGPCCYSVDKERADYFRRTWGEKTAVKRDRWYVDLKQANCALLKAAGVTDIRVAGACTCCDTRFGSFRREGSGGFTRMIALIGHLL